MNTDCTTCAQAYATLRVFHDNLDPDMVSEGLGLPATESWRRGELKDPLSRAPVIANYGAWLLRTPEQLESRDISCHIDWLLDRIETKRDVLHRLQEAGSEASVCCFWVSRPSHGHLSLSPATMDRLADLGLELEFDVFFQQEEELLEQSKEAMSASEARRAEP